MVKIGLHSMVAKHMIPHQIKQKFIMTRTPTWPLTGLLKAGWTHSKILKILKTLTK